jgi:hypothetical protein
MAHSSESIGLYRQMLQAVESETPIPGFPGARCRFASRDSERTRIGRPSSEAFKVSSQGSSKLPPDGCSECVWRTGTGGRQATRTCLHTCSKTCSSTCLNTCSQPNRLHPDTFGQPYFRSQATHSAARAASDGTEPVERRLLKSVSNSSNRSARSICEVSLMRSINNTPSR